MNRYPEYKDSGIEWIGEIPKSWRVIRLKYISNSNVAALSDTTDPEYQFTYIEIGDVDHIKGIVINEPITFAESPSRARRVVRPGDVIVSTVRTYLKAIGTVPKINDVICSTGFCVLTGREGQINQKFLAYSVLSDWFISFVISNSDGVSYPAINSSRLIELVIALPPLSEQQVVIRYLDKKIVQIDSLIEKLEKKIELLKEYRVALISQCVTKGLDPDAEMKDSGIEWIGEIPKGWNLKRLNSVCDHITEKRTPSENDVKISPENVEAHTGKVLSLYSNYESEGQVFREGDILFNKLRVYLNKVVLSKWTGLSMGEMIVLRPNAVCKEFVYRVLSSGCFIDYVNSLSEGVKMPRPPVEGILKAPLPIPDGTEQVEISLFICEKTTQIDSLIQKLEQKIELLKEYRQSLISNVVTGKIRVCEQIT